MWFSRKSTARGKVLKGTKKVHTVHRHACLIHYRNSVSHTQTTECRMAADLKYLGHTIVEVTNDYEDNLNKIDSGKGLCFRHTNVFLKQIH